MNKNTPRDGVMAEWKDAPEVYNFQTRVEQYKGRKQPCKHYKFWHQKSEVTTRNEYIEVTTYPDGTISARPHPQVIKAWDEHKHEYDAD